MVGEFETPIRAWEVDVSGNYAFVADDDFGLRILDISNPSSPLEVGTYLETGIWRITVSGNYAYVADDRSLRIIDITNPYFHLKPDFANCRDLFMKFPSQGITPI
jgi:hypothetical protein